MLRHESSPPDYHPAAPVRRRRLLYWRPHGRRRQRRPDYPDLRDHLFVRRLGPTEIGESLRADLGRSFAEGKNKTEQARPLLMPDAVTLSGPAAWRQPA